MNDVVRQISIQLKLKTPLKNRFLTISLILKSSIQAISFGTSACKDKECSLHYPHSHLELGEAYPSGSLGSPSSLGIKQVIKAKNENIHVSKNDRRNLNREGSQMFSPITFTPVKSKPHSQQVPKAALYQPSLAAGGSVDLSRTFTLTPHGTFSYGGKKNLPKISSKARLALKSKRVSSQHRNKVLVKNHSLALHQEGSPLKSQQYISPISTSSARNSFSPTVLDREMNSIGKGKSLAPPPSPHIVISHAPLSDTQVIIANQRSILPNMKEAAIHRVQRDVQTSYSSTVTDSYFPNILNR